MEHDEVFDYDMCEPGVKRLIIAMNKLVGVETTQSCEGHLNNQKEVYLDGSHSDKKIILPREGMIFFSPGYVDFTLSADNKAVLDFKKYLEKYNKVNGLYFGKNPFQEKENEFSLLTTLDGLLIPNRRFPTSDEHYHPPGYEVDKAKGIERHKLWQNTINEVIEYLSRQ